MWNFATVFETVARARPEQPALIHGEREVQWSELNERAGRLAAALRAAGLEPGDAVAQCLPNCPEYIESFAAATQAQLAPMNTNYRYVDDELLEVWQDADARAVVFDSSFADRVDRVRAHMPRVRAWIQVGDADSAADRPWVIQYESAVSGHQPVAGESGDADSLILIYTGGTTGRPKGVMWRQADLLSMLNAMNPLPLPDRADVGELEEAVQISRRGPTVLVASPLMHGAGLYYALSALIGSGTLVTLPTAGFEPDLLLDTVEKRQVKVLTIIGDAFARPLLNRLDAEPDRWDLSSLRAILSSGAMWSSAVKEGLLHHLPKVRLIDGLGSSEASAIASTESVFGDVGQTASFAPSDRAAVLLDDGTLATPGDGRVGRLAVTGWLPLGYLNDPVKTAEVFAEVDGRRWSIPGDLAQLESDGRVRLLGRGSSCINTGGEKVFPEEVEEVLKEHPDVADAAVVGVADECFGQSIVALVETVGAAVSAEALEKQARARLAGYKVPKLIHFVDSVDRGPNGKLDHRHLGEVARRAWETTAV